MSQSVRSGGGLSQLAELTATVTFRRSCLPWHVFNGSRHLRGKRLASAWRPHQLDTVSLQGGTEKIRIGE